MAALPDVLIVGGGVVGLAIALELRLRGATVIVLTRDFAEAASHAAAGMLAPQAEKILPGAMLELCLRSRALYPEWTQTLEAMTGLPIGYWSCGILAPVYEEGAGFDVSVQPNVGRRQEAEVQRAEEAEEAGGAKEAREQAELKITPTLREANAMESLCVSGLPKAIQNSKLSSVAAQNTTPNSKLLTLPTPVRLSAHVEAHAPHPTLSSWLDRPTIHQHQPGLSHEVIGGWWYPDDAQVDNRLLTKALWAAVRDAGVDLQEGVSVETIRQQGDRITSIQTSSGTMQSEQYVLATGAWSQCLLPIPVTPRKGQMLSVCVPPGQDLPLQTVLFGSDIYIVPRRDGRIVIGATSEDVGFTSNNTPEAVQTLLERATRLYPALRHVPLQEFWWGFRPATPDELPLLGASPYNNLTLATGHYRNGILLAPVTAQLIADRLWYQQSDPLLDAFHWSRFIV